MKIEIVPFNEDNMRVQPRDAFKWGVVYGDSNPTIMKFYDTKLLAIWGMDKAAYRCLNAGNN